jgi:hypothetical protein
MTKRNYIICLILSGLTTLLLLLKLFPWYPVNQYVWLDLAAIFGGGVFCSTIVSWIVEAQNAKRDQETQQKQREYILATVKSRFIRLYERELLELCTCYSKYQSSGNHPWINEDMPISSFSSKIIWLLDEFIFSERRYYESHHLNIEIIRQREKMFTHLFSNNLIYYKTLHQNLMELSTQFTTFLIAGVFTEEQIDVLKDLTFDLQDIINFSSTDDIDTETCLTFKKLLFEKTEKNLHALGISLDTSAHAHYRNVFPTH